MLISGLSVSTIDAATAVSGIRVGSSIFALGRQSLFDKKSGAAEIIIAAGR
jgi:hypothetical protein